MWGQEYQLSRSQRSQADTVRLFNIKTDPTETNNIAPQNNQVSLSTFLNFLLDKIGLLYTNIGLVFIHTTKCLNFRLSTN